MIRSRGKKTQLKFSIKFDILTEIGSLSSKLYWYKVYTINFRLIGIYAAKRMNS